MIEVTIHQNNQGEITGFKACGHADQAPRGQDIVCAAISTVFELLVDLTANFSSGAIKQLKQPAVPLWEWQVVREKITAEEAQLLDLILSSVARLLAKIAAGYPKNCRLSSPKQINSS